MDRSACWPWARSSSIQSAYSGEEAMPNIVVVGTQWGDEGKGKVVDMLAPHVNVVARFAGGNNAGNTVVVGREKYVLHSIPSGILRAGCRCVVGCGVVVDPGSLAERLQAVAGREDTL